MTALTTLKKRSDFQRVALSNKKWVYPFFILQAAQRAPKESLPSPCIRFGFIITKKLGNAVTRNRIRRRLKAALQLVLKRSSLQRESPRVYDVVLIARRSSFSAPFEVLVQTVEKTLEKIFSSDRPDAGAVPVPPEELSITLPWLPKRTL